MSPLKWVLCVEFVVEALIVFSSFFVGGSPEADKCLAKPSGSLVGS
jgi:hypothetical protein